MFMQGDNGTSVDFERGEAIAAEVRSPTSYDHLFLEMKPLSTDHKSRVDRKRATNRSLSTGRKVIRRTNEFKLDVIDDIEVNGLSYHEAAELYKIPRTTIVGWCKNVENIEQACKSTFLHFSMMVYSCR